MRDGYNIKRSYEFEHTRAICYIMAAANRDPKKKMPKMQDWWPLLTDEKVDKETEAKQLQEEYARLIDNINKKYGRNLTA